MEGSTVGLVQRLEALMIDEVQLMVKKKVMRGFHFSHAWDNHTCNVFFTLHLHERAV